MWIYNIKGQLIRSHSGNINAAREYAFLWDGKDNMGKQLSGGI